MANAPDTLIVSGPTFAQVSPANILVTPASGGAQQALGALLGALSSATGLTASGTTQANALALTALINQIGTAAASTGVALPASTGLSIGQSVIVWNDGANAIKVYGSASTTDTIDGTAGATGVTLTNANRCEFFLVAAGQWKSAKLGAVSS